MLHARLQEFFSLTKESIRNRELKYLGHFFVEFLHGNGHFWSFHKVINNLHDFSTLRQMPDRTSNSCKISDSADKI